MAREHERRTYNSKAGDGMVMSLKRLRVARDSGTQRVCAKDDKDASQDTAGEKQASAPGESRP